MGIVRKIRSVSLTRRNVASSLVGNLWMASISLVFTPVLVRMLGIESYGVIGVGVIIGQAVAQLDSGISITVNREIARLSANDDIPDALSPAKVQTVTLTGTSLASARTLLRTFEFVYWPVLLIIAAIVYFLAPFIANHWLKLGTVTPQTVTSSLRILGFALAAQWPYSLYEGGLLGLQRHTLINTVSSVGATAQKAGVILVLMFYRTVLAYFMWLFVVNAILTATVCGCLWYALSDHSHKPAFDIKTTYPIRRFAIGSGSVYVSNFLLGQYDRLILSNMLPLQSFGYYALAYQVATSLTMASHPVSMALFPRFVQMITISNKEELSKTFHRGCQVVAIMICPSAIVLAAFSKQIMLLWTRNTVTAASSYHLVTWLTAAYGLQSLFWVPSALQLASGWLKPIQFLKLGWLVALAPLMILLTHRFGATGAAGSLVIMHGTTTLIYGVYLIRHIIRGEQYRYLCNDIAVPFLVCSAFVYVCNGVHPDWSSSSMSLMFICSVVFAAVAVTALSASEIRPLLLGYLRRAANANTLA